MNRITQLQYDNLKKCVHDNLTEPILGENYYNLAGNTFVCDKMITEDLKYEFDRRNKEIKFYKIILTISIIINVLALILYFWRS